jgi:recombinational DNA repair protein (RecF pathway)
LTEAESLIANATDSAAVFYVKEIIIDLANKNVEANANFLLLQKHIKI